MIEGVCISTPNFSMVKQLKNSNSNHSRKELGRDESKELGVWIKKKEMERIQEC